MKCLLRNRHVLFWSLLFPVVLALFFNMAFSNLAKGEVFKSIPVAVVNNTEYQSSTSFKEALKSVSDDNEASTDKLFHVTVESKEQAADDLKNNKVDGYILFENGAHVVVKSSDTDQTIIKEFVDSYLQTASAYSSVLSKNPSAAKSIMSTKTQDFIAEKTAGKSTADDTTAYYFALIAMAVMFGGFWGKEEVENIQADSSFVGARINLAPVHKLKAFVYSFCAAVTVDFCCLLALFAFLTLVLGLDFGNQTGYILAVCFFGSITGVSFGAFIAVMLKGSSHLKGSIMVAINLLTSCLAGLMSLDVKYLVTSKFPVMAYINPANLISDALYSLNYYSTYTRFYTNIACLCGLSIVYIMTVYLVIRRQKYASI
jgi:ABC-2 type transport system permease protein